MPDHSCFPPGLRDARPSPMSGATKAAWVLAGGVVLLGATVAIVASMSKPAAASTKATWSPGDNLVQPSLKGPPLVPLSPTAVQATLQPGDMGSITLRSQASQAPYFGLTLTAPTRNTGGPGGVVQLGLISQVGSTTSAVFGNAHPKSPVQSVSLSGSLGTTTLTVTWKDGGGTIQTSTLTVTVAAA